MIAIFSKIKFKYFILRRKLKVVSFNREMKYLNLFAQKSPVIGIRGGKLKEWNAKNRTEKPSFSNKMFLEYKATKLP